MTGPAPALPPLYPVNLGHNFVLADEDCNGKKSHRLAACDHLARWCERNAMHGATLAAAFATRGIVHDFGAT